METKSDGYLEFIESIAKEDVAGLLKAHESYGDSWKKRGGIGAYMVMIRKIDRMERQVERYGYDVVKAVEADQRPEGLIDDIRDARRYLMLIESWLREMGLAKAGDHRDNKFDNHRNFDGVSRSYDEWKDLEYNVMHDIFKDKATGKVFSCRDVDMSDMLRHDPECVAGDVMLQTDRAKHPIKTTQLKCIAHIPDAICECSRCQAMAKLAKQPHIKDCECKNCKTAKRDYVDRLRREQKRREQFRDRGKTHAGVTGIVQDQLKAEAAERQRKLYENNPHPVQCECDMCLAEHDGPCLHDCDYPACKKARGDQNG